jgi:hypothetical protein
MAGGDSAPTGLRVLNSEYWEIGGDPDGHWLVGAGERSEHAVSSESQVEFVGWLIDACWLDGVPEKLSDRAWRNEAIAAIRQLHDQLGAVSLRCPPLATQVPASAHRLSRLATTTASDLHGAEPAEAAVHIEELILDLSLLRRGLLLSFAATRSDSAAVHQQLAIDRMSKKIAPEFLESAASGADGARSAARTWLALAISIQLGRHALEVTLRPAPDPGPARFELRPRTALDALWLAASVSVGAIEPPFPISGVFKCDYPVCGRVFFGDRAHSRGQNRFCSNSCGKRFHAARSTTKQREAWKEARRARGGGA